MTFSEILLTIIAIWILFRIFRNDEPRRSTYFTFRSHHPGGNNGPAEKENKTEKKRKEIDGEYVDYEEIK